MASLLVGSCKMFLFLVLLSSPLFYLTTSIEFLVGGDDGWTIPKKGEEMYNDWASKNRFKVNDTLHFKYSKDSVMEVTEEEYKKCRSSHPLFFSNNGDTVYTLDRAGLFYFVSGVNGHCERGQKLIVKVLEPAIPPQSAEDSSSGGGGGSSTSNGLNKKNVAAQTIAISSSTILLLTLVFV